MPEFPGTRESLIIDIRDPTNRQAWDQFERLYRPVIFRIARAKGLQHADALDLVQQVLASVAAAINRYEKRNEDTRFRNWISRITRNAIVKSLTRAPCDRAIGGSAILDVLSDVTDIDAETDALIELEYRREIFRRAAEQVRSHVQESSWLAFELTALQHTPVDKAAELIGISTGSVYAARSRVMRRIRDRVAQLLDSSFASKESR